MRLKFVTHMTLLASVFLAIALNIQTTQFFRWVLWGLFVYIIAKDLVDEYKLENQPRKDARLRRQIMDKLDRAIDQVKKIV